MVSYDVSSASGVHSGLLSPETLHPTCDLPLFNLMDAHLLSVSPEGHPPCPTEDGRGPDLQRVPSPRQFCPPVPPSGSHNPDPQTAAEPAPTHVLSKEKGT